MSASSNWNLQPLSEISLYRQLLSSLPTDDDVENSQGESNKYPFNAMRLSHAQNTIERLRERWYSSAASGPDLKLLNLWNKPVGFHARQRPIPGASRQCLYLDFKHTHRMAHELREFHKQYKSPGHPGNQPPIDVIPSPMDIKSRILVTWPFHTYDTNMMRIEFTETVESYQKDYQESCVNSFGRAYTKPLGLQVIHQAVYFPSKTMTDRNGIFNENMCKRLLTVHRIVQRFVTCNLPGRTSLVVRKPTWTESPADTHILATLNNPTVRFVEDITAFASLIRDHTLVIAIKPDIPVCDILAGMEPQRYPKVLVCRRIGLQDQVDDVRELNPISQPVQEMIQNFYYAGNQWTSLDDPIFGELWVYVRKN